MGWIYRGSAYCQLIRDVNRPKRLEFAMASLHDKFDDAIFMVKYCKNVLVD